MRSLVVKSLEFAVLAAGAVLIGLVLALVLEPNGIVAGGVTGLAMILHELTGLSTGVLLVALNLPILWLGWRYLGGRWLVVRTIVGVLLVAVSVDLAASWCWVATSDRILVIFYGGVLSGLGLALVFRARGTTGGADILGRLLKVWFDFEIGQSILLMNTIVFILAAWVYGLEKAAIALIVSFVMTKALDTTLHGMSATRSALILTARPDEVKDRVWDSLHRSIVTLKMDDGRDARGQTILSVVVPRAESARLKRQVLLADPDAYLVIHTPSETVGVAPRGG